MKSVTLIFPTVASLAEFLIVERISSVETDSIAKTITAVLADQQIASACTKYNACLLGHINEIDV
ncbi:MAG: hypothetical protein EOO16_12255 [Chitinophagaceae bacterium]|nr:MAG: hypothetical protein EOO16_12255 [Chitinophagaceae bacterium]